MVKFLVVVLALAAVVAGENNTEDTEVVRNARGICSQLSNIVGAAADAAAFLSTGSSSSSSSSSSGNDCGSGDSFELIQLSPSQSGAAQQQIGGNSGPARIPAHVAAAAAFGGSNSVSGGGAPHVTTRVVGQNVRQLGNGPKTSIREGPSHVVSGGGAPIYTSQPSQLAQVQQAPAPSYQSAPAPSYQSAPAPSYQSSPVSNGQCCQCSCCAPSNNGQQASAPRQVEYVHIEHPPQYVEKIVEHHIEHPPQIIETVVETVVDHPPQIIEHTNHVVEQVPHVMIARGQSHNHEESSSNSYRNNIADPIRMMKGKKF